MRFNFNTLTTYLPSIGDRKIQSSSRNAHLPNISNRRNPRLAARSARLRAAKSMRRVRNMPSASNISSSNDPVHGTIPNPSDRPAKRQRAARPLRRRNNVILPPPATRPQMPGAFVLEPSFVVPGFPELDDGNLPPLVRQKLFLDALYEGRQAILRATAERRTEAEARMRADDAEYMRLLQQDLTKAQAAHLRAEDAEYVRLLAEDLRKAQAAHMRAEDAEYVSLLVEDLKKAQAAHRRAVDEEFVRLLAEDLRKAHEREAAARKERERQAEERRRQAEDEESRERARRLECERRERERLESERMSQGVPAEAAAEQLFLAEWVRVYEEKWAVLRGVVPVVEQLRFCDIPWPLFGNVQSVEDITVERVLEFVCHPLNECIRGASAGQTTKSLRSEMLRWHPDKFGKVLERVVEGDREVVMMAAGNVARILTKLNAEVR